MASARDALRWKYIASSGNDKVDEGFYTTEQISKMIGLKMTATKNMIKEKMNEGLFEKKTFRITRSGKPYCIPHYKITEKAIKKIDENLQA